MFIFNRLYIDGFKNYADTDVFNSNKIIQILIIEEITNSSEKLIIIQIYFENLK